MDDDLKWFAQFNNSETKTRLKENPIAYFCAEYALTPDLPIYAGGLGVLAGDFLREAADQNFPLVAVGLYYSDGYETLHKVDEKGYIEAPHVHAPPENYGLQPIVDKGQNLVTVDIPIHDRNIKAKAWEWHVGKIPIYLLDTNVEENSEDDRKITDHLYVVDRETRLKQKIILGIGGIRLLEKLVITPSLYHMNEGYSSLLCFEVARKEMREKKIGFSEAKEVVRQKIVFTNHTLVTGGDDTYNNELASLLLSKYATELGVPASMLVETGNVPDSSTFSTTLLALHAAGRSNAVSGIHGKKAGEIWPNNPMIPITNGIHINSWNAVDGAASIWQSHLENKGELVKKINLATGITWDSNTLLLGWARRLVNYKRPLAIFENIERLKSILMNKEKPARIVISGNLHPSDIADGKIFEELRIIADEKLKALVVFLPEYDLALAKLMTAGCDVWFNTPIVGFEACGTSGMKAALNGGLPCSTRDGWMDEVELYGIGWALDDDKINTSILDTLEQKVIPLYYERDANNVPQAWQQNMKNCRDLIKNEFSVTRMLREYIEKLYLPLQ